MTTDEAHTETQRLKKFNALNARQAEIYRIINCLNAPWPTGPHEQNPYTGNARETRRIKSLKIEFTTTLGGAPEVTDYLYNLGIEAYEFRQWLEGVLKDQQDALREEMRNL